MPVIAIRSLPLKQEVDVSSLLKKLCTITANAIGYDPKHIWATWEYLQPGHYAVGGKTADIQQVFTHSPIVRVLSFEGKPQEQVEKMLHTITDVLSEGLGISRENIFIEYSEARSGHVLDGGNIVYSKGQS